MPTYLPIYLPTHLPVLQSYTNKHIELEVVGYRLRAIRSNREKVLGHVRINLSVLAHSSPYFQMNDGGSSSGGTSNNTTFSTAASSSSSIRRQLQSLRLQCSPQSVRDSLGGSVTDPIEIDIDPEQQQQHPSSSHMSIAEQCGWYLLQKEDMDSRPEHRHIPSHATEHPVKDCNDTQLRVGIRIIKNNNYNNK